MAWQTQDYPLRQWARIHQPVTDGLGGKAADTATVFPFRDHELIDKLITHFVEGGFDTVIPARKEYNSCWMEEEGTYRRIDEGYISRQFKQPFFTGLKGLCCVCSPATVRVNSSATRSGLRCSLMLYLLSRFSQMLMLCWQRQFWPVLCSRARSTRGFGVMYNISIVGLGHVAAHQIAALES